MKKNIIKVSLILSGVLLGSSCGDFLDINQDPNNATDASVEQLLAASQLSMGSVLGGQHIDGSGSINEDPSIFIQHYYNLNQSRYDISPSDYDANWRDLFREGLKDIEEIITKGTADQLWTHVAIAQIQKAYIFTTFVDLWGEVPYTQALQGQNNLSPEFDEGENVYDAALLLLDEAIVNLNKTALAPQNDIYFDGNAESWLRLANSLKLNLYTKIRLVNPDRSKAAIEALIADDKLLTSSEMDWQFLYGAKASPENRHPLFIENYVACCNQFPSAYMIYTLNDQNDPRLPYYFYRQSLDDPEDTDIPCDAINCSPYPNNGYYGRGYFSRVQGDDSGLPNDGTIRTTFGVYPAGGLYDLVELDGEGDPITTRTVSISSNSGAGVQPFLTYFMVLFARAEAALTLSTGEDARALLEDALREQIIKVISFGTATDAKALGLDDQVLNDLTGEPTGITVEEQMENYISDRIDDYDNAASDEERLEVIMTEKHKAMFGIGWESYTDYRRTGYPRFFNMIAKDGSFVDYPATAREAALVPNGEFPRRLLFPSLELNSNPNSPPQTTKATPVFWDKK